MGEKRSGGRGRYEKLRPHFQGGCTTRMDGRVGTATGTTHAYFLGNLPSRLHPVPTEPDRNASRKPQKGPRRRSGDFLG